MKDFVDGTAFNNEQGNRADVFDFNFNLECIGVGTDCETAFAKGNSDVDSVCFIDDEDYKKYYLVIKTESNTPIEEITVLKFTEVND